MRSTQSDLIILNEAAANGIGTPLRVTDFRNAAFKLSTSGSTTATIKVLGFIGSAEPDFSASQSVSNSWGYLQMIDLNDGAGITGATGVALTGTDVLGKMYEVNTNNVDWITLQVSGYSGSGKITAIGLTTSNL